MKRREIYLLSTVICFLLCILIVKLLSDYLVIRGFIGDIIVTILIYCFIKMFVDLKPLKLSIFVLMFSYIVELMQYYKVIEIIGLGNNEIAQIIIGTTFDFRDLLAYTIGVIIVYLLDTRLFIGKWNNTLIK